MSEEIKAKVVEEENLSTAEKETKALKKIGADTGVETITKVDLRQPLNKEEDAIQEQSTDEVPVRDEPESSEEIQKENETQSKEPPAESEQKEEEVIIEEVIENTTEEKKEKIKPQPEPEPIIEANTEKKEDISIPEGVFELVNFMNETGGSMEDYVKLNKNYANLDDKTLLQEFYKTTKPHLNNEEINFLIEDGFSYNEDIDDPIEIKRKELSFKEEVANAKSFLENQKDKYYKEVKTTSNLSKEQQKAVDFFNRYNNEQKEIAQIQEKASNMFKQKTNEVFNDEFKGFDFNVDNKKYRFKLKDVEQVKNTQSDIMNVIGSYLDNNTLKDGYGYHKALFAAKNADNIANHFYQLGKAEAIKEISAESKNINMDPRQTNSGYVESGGIKVRAISGDDSSKLRIKLKK
jgi:hypothetical protein